MTERRLGRGLDFFLSRSNAAKEATPEIHEVDVATLSPNPFQPRREFSEDSLKELAESIRANGILQPILVRRTPTGGHQIVAGERRWRAAKLLGLERVPAVVREISDEHAAVFALVENVQRSDLNPMDKASGFARLLEITKASREDLARRLGVDRSTVANFIRLLDLAPPVQAFVSRGTLSMGHARALLGLAVETQTQLAELAIRDRLSVREVEARAQALKAGGAPVAAAGATKKKGKARPVWLNEIEDTLAETLGAAVQVRYGRKRSLISIECRGREDFERVYEMLKAIDED